MEDMGFDVGHPPGIKPAHALHGSYCPEQVVTVLLLRQSAEPCSTFALT